jgi:hypothetical protein
MTLVLPGVEIKVVKEIIVGQLNPAGILGLIGITEDNEDGSTKDAGRASSYKSLKSMFGRSLDYTVPEAKQAFQNGISEIVMVPVSGTTARKAYAELHTSSKTGIRIEARAKGSWGNRIKVKVEPKADDTGKMSMARVVVSYGNAVEFFDNLELNPTAERYVCNVINESSDIITAKPFGKGKRKEKEEESKEEMYIEPVELNLSEGRSATLKDYEKGLERLQSEEDVDLVVASIDDYGDPAFVKAVYQSIEAHCRVMSENAYNRIGFGQAPPSTNFKNAEDEVNFITRQLNTISSDRFVYVAPHGSLGAVAGLVGNLPVHQSPTYKSLSGISELERNYSPSQLKELLKANVLALETKKGRGIIIEKGVCTSGEQISVQRIADRAVRGTKMIGDKFIGTLNTVSGRAALKEKCTEFFIQMEKEGMIVPSADGTDPAYKVDVYATDDDIAKGIVRVDIAVRPVRAIDYIYGTILVRA